MLIGGPELRKALAANPDLKWFVAPLPDKNALDAGNSTRATPLRVSGWAISTKTSQVEAAQQVAERLSGVTFDGWLPARVSPDGDDPATAVFSEALAKSLPPSSTPRRAAP